MVIAKCYITTEGVLVIEAERFHTQEKNRIYAVARLVVLIQQALVAPNIPPFSAQSIGRVME
jgi:hypothetical protein